MYPSAGRLGTFPGLDPMAHLRSVWTHRAGAHRPSQALLSPEGRGAISCSLWCKISLPTHMSGHSALISMGSLGSDIAIFEGSLAFPLETTAVLCAGPHMSVAGDQEEKHRVYGVTALFGVQCVNCLNKSVWWSSNSFNYP